MQIGFRNRKLCFIIEDFKYMMNFILNCNIILINNVILFFFPVQLRWKDSRAQGYDS